MTGNYRKRLAATSVLALAISAGVWINGTEAGGPKTYTSVATTPTLQSGSQTAGITLTNTSRNKIAFNAINITVPVGLTVTNPATLSPIGGTATVNGSTIELRDLNTPQGAAVTVTFAVTASPQSPCATYTFTSDVRQSNDFNGQNNQFALVGAAASMTGPCSSSSVTCTAGDAVPCATGIIESANDNTASVIVNDDDEIDATLTASLTPGALTCAEYTPTSDQLQFDIDVTGGDLTNVTKTVTFTQPYDGTREDWEYQACFQAPYDFPALLPSQLDEDFATSDFSGNTAEGPAGTFTGLLLPCAAGYGIPCLDGVPVVDLAAGTVSITIEVAAADPATRF